MAPPNVDINPYLDLLHASANTRFLEGKHSSPIQKMVACVDQTNGKEQI